MAQKLSPIFSPNFSVNLFSFKFKKFFFLEKMGMAHPCDCGAGTARIWLPSQIWAYMGHILQKGGMPVKRAGNPCAPMATRARQWQRHAVTYGFHL